MRLNKLLAMVLATIMVITSIGAVFAADGETESYYAEAISIMKDFGLVDNLPINNENNLVTREQFTAAVLDLINMPAVEANCPLEDIQNSAYKTSIQTAYQLGLAKGYNSLFRPSDIITINEAATFLVNALGYSVTGLAPTQQAQKLGLYDGIRYAPNKELKAGETARLLFNAGNTVITSEVYSTAGVSTYVGSQTIFEYYLGIYYGKGILEANQFTTLKSDRGIGVNRVRIGNFTGRIYYNSDILEFLGCNVGYYCKKATDGVYDILKLYLLDSNNIIKIQADDMVSYSKSDGTISLTYYNRKSQNTVSFAGSTPVIFNGSLTTDYTYTNAKGENVSIFQPDNGEITLIDNNNDGNIDAVHVLLLENTVVSTVNAEEQIIYDRYDAAKIINFEDNENKDDTSWVIFDPKGDIVPIENLKEWNIISVAKSRNGYALRGVCSTDSVSGTVSSVSKSGNYQVVLIEGVEYKVALDFAPATRSLKRGDNGTFYLDYTGKIAAADFGAGEGKYGYYIDSIMDPAAFSQNAIALITNEMGIPTKMKLATKVKIDGDSYSGSAVPARLAAISGEINAIKTAAYSGISLKGVQTTDCADTRYPIVYKVNVENEINYIDTQIRGAKEDANTLHAKNEILENHAFIAATDTFGAAYAVVGNTIYMEIPDYNRIHEHECYRVMPVDSISSGEKYVRGFSTDSESYLSEFIVAVSGEVTTLSTTSPVLLVEEKYTAMDSDGELVDVLTGYNDDGVRKELTVPRDYTLKGSAVTYGTYVSNINPGDVVKYATSPIDKNEIMVMSKIYDGKTFELGEFIKISSSQAYLGYKWFADAGYLYSNSISDRILTMLSVYDDKINNADYGAHAGIEPANPHFYKTKANTTKIFKVKPLVGGGVEIKNISTDLNQLESYQMHNSKLKTFIYYRYENARMLVQYEEQ